jgi:hypothetical protein
MGVSIRVLLLVLRRAGLTDLCWGIERQTAVHTVSRRREWGEEREVQRRSGG